MADQITGNNLEEEFVKVSCPVCNSENAEQFRYTSDIVKCADCNTVYLRTRFNEQTHSKIFSEMTDDEELLESEEDLNNALLSREEFYKELQEIEHDKGVFLDIGSGWGSLLNIASKAGYEVNGYELNHNKAGFAVERLGLKVKESFIDDSEFHEEASDVIATCYSLPFLANLNQYVEIIYGSLKPGGIFCGIVPNIDSYASEILEDEWDYITPYENLIYFSPETLKAYLGKMGFTVEKLITKTGSYHKEMLEFIVQDFFELDDLDEINDKIEELNNQLKGEEIWFFVRKAFSVKSEEDILIDNGELTIENEALPVESGKLEVESSEENVQLSTEAQIEEDSRLSENESAVEDMDVENLQPEATENELVIEIRAGDDYDSLIYDALLNMTGPQKIKIIDKDGILPDYIKNWNAVEVVKSEKDSKIDNGELIIDNESLPVESSEEEYIQVEETKSGKQTTDYEESSTSNLQVSSESHSERSEESIDAASEEVKVNSEKLEENFQPSIDVDTSTPISNQQRIENELITNEKESTTDNRQPETENEFEEPPTSDLQHEGTENGKRKTENVFLNLGCGKDIRKDFVNIDLFVEAPGIIKMDVRNLEYEDESVDLILASDILEHFSHREVDTVLKEWARVLKAGGNLIVRCPSLSLQMNAYMRGDWNADVASYMIFGGQTNPGDFHCIAFDEASIIKHLDAAGFDVLDLSEKDIPQDKDFINLNMTVRAKKKEDARTVNTEPIVEEDNHEVMSSDFSGLDFGDEETTPVKSDTSTPLSDRQTENGTPRTENEESSKSNFQPSSDNHSERGEESIAIKNEKLKIINEKEELTENNDEALVDGDSRLRGNDISLINNDELINETEEQVLQKDTDNGEWRTENNELTTDNRQLEAEIISENEKQDSDNGTSAPLSNQVNADNGERKTENGKLLNIVWEGPFFVYSSLGLVNRELCYNLIKTGLVNLTIVPSVEDDFSADGNEKYELLKQHDIRFKEEVDDDSASLPYVWIRHQWPPKDEDPKGSKWIVMQPWEYSSLWQEIADVFKKANEVWTPSTYSRNAIVNSGVEFDNVQTIPNGIDPELFKPFGDKYALNTDKKFKFLYVGGTIQRKGIDILLTSYIKTFKKEDDVCLVIKDLGGDSFYKGLNAKAKIEEFRDNPNLPEIIYIDEMLSEEDMADLYRACDVLVSPYRGEGFSLPTLEAMACGLPTIVTQGGATDDFCDELTSWLISSHEIELGEILDGKPLVAPATWLEPDIEKLIEVMRTVFDNPSEVFTKGMIASLRARTTWTWQRAAGKIFSRLDYLYDNGISTSSGLLASADYDNQSILAKAIKAIVDNDTALSAQSYHLILENEPTKAEQNIALIGLTYLNLLNMDLNQAEEYINELRKEAETHVDYKYFNAKLHFLKNEWVEGLEAVTELLDNWADWKYSTTIGLTLDELLCDTAEALLELDDPDNSLKLYSQALKENVNSSRACLGSAKCFLWGDAKDEAKEMLEWALKLDPYNQEAKDLLEKEFE